jgi:hypothetical protein
MAHQCIIDISAPPTTVPMVHMYKWNIGALYQNRYTNNGCKRCGAHCKRNVTLWYALSIIFELLKHATSMSLYLNKELVHFDI